MTDREIAEQARKTAQGILDTIRDTRARGDNATEAILIRTFHTLSEVHRKAVGTGLRVAENWTVEEAI